MACNWGSNCGCNCNCGGCNQAQRRGCTCLANDVRNLIEELEEAFEELEEADCIRSTNQNSCGCNNNCACNRGCGCCR
nr:hypothetical protein [uncultured Niameybacter sp.]